MVDRVLTLCKALSIVLAIIISTCLLAFKLCLAGLLVTIGHLVVSTRAALCFWWYQISLSLLSWLFNWRSLISDCGAVGS